MMRSTSQYQRHVGRHQEQLALFALPTVETDDKDERGGESDSSAESMDMISNQDERGDSNKQPKEPATSYSMLGTDEMTALPVNNLITSMTNGLTENFIPRDGIDREVITADICRYLENKALVRPGHYEVRKNKYIPVSPKFEANPASLKTLEPSKWPSSSGILYKRSSCLNHSE
ncbi:hypothetical protein FocTR4_00013396 [Fusarium oxysporum f. sp. cubense]|nr:hypothetical protein FocTR4_00013396 [Fusarium oxysporum f. sp. cubense]